MSLVAQEVLTCHFCGEPITKMSGHESDSLCNHHITYIPEVKVPAHHECHLKYHGTHPEHPKNPEAEYRERIIESLDGDVICHFCGEQVIKMNGVGSESLLIHSLDGNHYNWDPTNKVPTHHGCHTKYHGINMDEAWKTRKERYGPCGFKDPDYMKGENNPMYGNTEAAERGWQTRRDRYGQTGCNGEHHSKRPEQRERFSRKNPMKDPETAKKATQTRFERHGPSGVKDPEQAWRTRRARYGPSGFKDPEAHAKAISEGMTEEGVKKGWEKRRELYGPSGRKVK